MPTRPHVPSRPTPLLRPPAPVAAPRTPRRVRIAHAWGTHRIEVRELAAGEALTVGPSPRADLHVPTPDGCDWQLAQTTRDGARLLLPIGVSTLRTKQGEITPETLAEAGLATGLPGAVSCELRAGDAATCTFGALTITVEVVEPTPAVVRPFAQRELHFESTLVIGLLVALAAERMLALTDLERMPWDGATDRGDVGRSWTVTPLPPPAPAPAGAPDDAAAPKPSGIAGETTKTRPKPSGTRSARAQDVGLLAALAQAGTMRGLFETGSASLNAALGKVRGSGSVADAGGLDGMGTRGGGDGGGDRTMKVGGLGFGREGGHGCDGACLAGLGIGFGVKTATPFIDRAGDPLDGLSAGEIGRVMRRHAAEIKACFEAELRRNPALYGKVAMAFEINPLGEVSIVNVKESTLGSAAVEGCMSARIRTWRFPEPRGGGVVNVTYSWVFSVAR